MKQKLVLLLVEGSTEEIVYLNLLEKLYNMERTSCKTLPETARKLIEPLLDMAVTRLKCLSSKTEQPKRHVVLVNCGGYERAKKLLKLLLKRYELPYALEEFETTLAIAADMDKNPLEGVKGVLNSLKNTLNLEFETANHNTIEVLIGRGHGKQARLEIHVIEQGLHDNNSTRQIEDELQNILEEAAKHLATDKNLVDMVRENNNLTSKQKLLIYLALLDNKIKVRKLLDKLNEILDRVERDILAKGLKNLVEKLEKTLN